MSAKIVVTGFDSVAFASFTERFQEASRRSLGEIVEHGPAVAAAKARLNATQDSLIPGLWHAPGYPELTTGQLLQAAAKKGLFR